MKTRPNQIKPGDLLFCARTVSGYNHKETRYTHQPSYMFLYDIETHRNQNTPIVYGQPCVYLGNLNLYPGTSTAHIVSKILFGKKLFYISYNDLSPNNSVSFKTEKMWSHQRYQDIYRRYKRTGELEKTYNILGIDYSLAP